MVGFVGTNLKFALIPRLFENLQLIGLQSPQLSLSRLIEADAKPLPGSRLAILHAGIANIGIADTQGTGNPARNLGGGLTGFFNP